MQGNPINGLCMWLAYLFFRLVLNALVALRIGVSVQEGVLRTHSDIAVYSVYTLGFVAVQSAYHCALVRRQSAYWIRRLCGNAAFMICARLRVSPMLTPCCLSPRSRLTLQS